MPAESLSASEAARLLGVSVPTLKELCARGRLGSFRTAGNHVRVAKADLERFRQGSGSPGPAPVSSVLQNRRERIEELGLEVQERRAKREIQKLEDEDTEAERRRAAAAQAEDLEHKAALEEACLQRECEAARRATERRQAQAQKERTKWVGSYVGSALNGLPQDAPLLDVRAAVEEALANLTPDQPETVVRPIALAAVLKALKPWKHQKEIQQAIQEARKELPALAQGFFEPSEWELRAMQAAREAIAKLPADASLAEIRAAAVQVGKQVATEYEAEQARARAEQERQRRESMKSFLLSVGVRHVAPYLAKLQVDGAIWDEDLARKPELETAVRETLEQKLSGDESFDDAQGLAREVIDAQLEWK